MSTSTRITRSKGESDRLSLPMRMRPTRRDTTSGRNGGTALSTPGWEQQQQVPTQTPHLTQSPEAASAERTATAPMLPPGPHRPLTPRMPLPTLPTSSPHSSAPLFKEDRYSSTSEEESEVDEVTFTHGKTMVHFWTIMPKDQLQHQCLLTTQLRVIPMHHLPTYLNPMT